MGAVLGIIAIKGGVGKTTIASSIAADLVNHYGEKVLLIDANYSAPNLGLHMDIVEPYKTIHHVLDGKTRIDSAIHNKFGVDVIPGSYVYNNEINTLKLKERINAIKKEYDFVVIDSSPSLNEEVLSTMLASDALFVVTTPDVPTLSCSLRAAKLAKQKGRPIAGIILNKVRDPAYELNIKDIEHLTGIPVVAKIYDEKKVGRAVHMRMPVPIYKRNTKFAKEINRLNAALTGYTEKQSAVHHLLPTKFKQESVNRQLMKEKFYSNVFAKEDD